MISSGVNEMVNSSKIIIFFIRKSEGIITLQRAPISSALSFPGGSKLCTSMEYSMSGFFPLLQLLENLICTFSYMAKRGRKPIGRVGFAWAWEQMSHLLPNNSTTFSSTQSSSLSHRSSCSCLCLPHNHSTSVKIWKTCRKQEDTGWVIPSPPPKVQLDKSSQWQWSTRLSLVQCWETDTSESDDFPSLIRIFKGNFPQEKHFNTTSLMTHQHGGL